MKLKNILCEKTVNRANFDNLTYSWSLENENFEVTKKIHDELYGMIYNFSNAFYIEKIEKYLSELFGTSIKNISCRAGRKDFGLSFTGKGVYFTITFNF